MSERVRIDRLCIGDSIERILVWELCNRVEGGEKSVFLCAITWVCTWRKRFSCFSSIRKGTGCLSINDVRCDGQDRGRWFGIAVGMAVFQLFQEGTQQKNGKIVCTVIVVSVAREVALYLKILCNAVFVADDLYFCVLDRT